MLQCACTHTCPHTQQRSRTLAKLEGSQALGEEEHGHLMPSPRPHLLLLKAADPLTQ